MAPLRRKPTSFFLFLLPKTLVFFSTVIFLAYLILRAYFIASGHLPSPLGNTPPLTAEGNGNVKTLVYLTYWKSLDGLHQFTHNETPMKGWMWWDRGATCELKHVEVMHEAYVVEPGDWENIFHNFGPFTISNTKVAVEHECQEERKEGEEESQA
ncbi:hypothetical protein K469DRAFT_697209 [Zopfia rhizophila CBS 207.26]|uniref:Uncharacterized protein n=1 Tax=Zopfia rhizophila CBS 207.26 TaxID=1314779 RepID=A0A6A6ELB3_9PEZI|nr:hypothetical protein K469DRAFT_697209 [Zopfia rhizophila CBS 207.26]